MSFKEKFKNIIQELNAIDINDDFKREELWKKEIKIVTEDINETIKYLKNECTSEEFVLLSEIFREIIEICPSKEFVDELYNLAKKYPEDTKKYNVMNFIEEVDNYLKDE